jgi:2-polyprenyl-6-methoxyphenol hydroxylase-like FAD-dependent oxidoreductase
MRSRRRWSTPAMRPIRRGFTLSSMTPPIRPDGTGTQGTVGEHAVVLGASLAGLATAAALAGRFDCVTIIERDLLSAIGEPRHGVPQGRHAHLLLPAGLRGLAELLPGFLDDLRIRGAHLINSAEFRFYLGGGRLALDSTELAVSGATRPLIEDVVQQRVRALTGVSIVDGCDAIGLATRAGGANVTGARIRQRAGTGEVETVNAALVVDATGRASHAPQWMVDLGYVEPTEERLEVGVHYTTRLFRRASTDLDGCRHAVVGMQPVGRRGGLALAVEGDRWLVTLVGASGERPPTDLAGFVDYARSLWRPDLHEIVVGANPIGEASIGAFPAYLRRRYDRLQRLPGGFVVTGDAVCALNPVYAQGMSVAILEAQTLGQVLDRHGLDQVGRRFARRARPIVDAAWTLATGADLSDPAVEGPRPASWRFINAYVTRLLAVAQHDPVVANAFLEVNAMVAPPQRILRPRLVMRVLRGRRTGRPRRYEQPHGVDQRPPARASGMGRPHAKRPPRD